MEPVGCSIMGRFELWFCAGEELPLSASLFLQDMKEWTSCSKAQHNLVGTALCAGMEKPNLERGQDPLRDMYFHDHWNGLKSILQFFKSFGQRLYKIYWSPLYIY